MNSVSIVLQLSADTDPRLAFHLVGMANGTSTAEVEERIAHYESGEHRDQGDGPDQPNEPISGPHQLLLQLGYLYFGEKKARITPRAEEVLLLIANEAGKDVLLSKLVKELRGEGNTLNNLHPAIAQLRATLQALQLPAYEIVGTKRGPKGQGLSTVRWAEDWDVIFDLTEEE